MHHPRPRPRPVVACFALLQYKIGPDPSSIDSCMIGGIVANNSSGMCCGVSQNTYHTLKVRAGRLQPAPAHGKREGKGREGQKACGRPCLLLLRGAAAWSAAQSLWWSGAVQAGSC